MSFTRLHKSGISTGGLLMIVGALLAAQVARATPYTPLEWQPKIVNSPWDIDGNFVDDEIDNMDPQGTVDVIVNLNGCLSDELRDHFNTLVPTRLAETDIGVYLTTAVLRQISVASAILLGSHPAVAMVELDDNMEIFLDVSNPAMKVRASANYSPNTVSDRYPAINGAGVNIAVLDTGVDDGLHESLPAAVAGFDALSGLQINPPDGAPTGFGHGTHVAGIALGRGGAGEPNPIGVARGAGLVDVRVLGGKRSNVELGIQYCIKFRMNANIRVMNMSLGNNRRSNGLDSLSMLSNLAVEKCISVVVAAGNTGNLGPGTPDNLSFVPSPAAADDVITVGAAAYVPIGGVPGTINRMDDTLAFFSLTGPRIGGRPIGSGTRKPDVTGPGASVNRRPNFMGEQIGILAAKHGTVNQYVRGMGTSMAAPHIAGLAALAIQANSTPARGRIPPLAVKKLILDTVTNDPTNPPPPPFLPDPPQGQWNAFWGWGYADAFSAIDKCQPDVPLGNNTAQTDVHFTGPDFPAPVCCDRIVGPFCPDIFPSNPAIVQGVPNVLNARVHNSGPNPATNVRVRTGVYITGNSPATFWICEKVIPLIPVGQSRIVSCPWVPRTFHQPPAPPVTHACLKGEIIYPCDSNFRNNCGQRNIDIQNTNFPLPLAAIPIKGQPVGGQSTASGGTRVTGPPSYVQMPLVIENPFDEDLQIVVEAACPGSPQTYPSPAPAPPAPWTFEVLDQQERPFEQCRLLLPTSCRLQILVRMDPGSSQCGALERDIRIWGLPPDADCPNSSPGEAVYLSGALMRAQIPTYLVRGGGSYQNGQQISVVRIDFSGAGQPNPLPNSFGATQNILGEFNVVDYATHKAYQSFLVESINGSRASPSPAADFTVTVVASVRINNDDENTRRVDLVFFRNGGQLRYRLLDHGTQEILLSAVERPGLVSATLSMTPPCKETPCGK